MTTPRKGEPLGPEFLVPDLELGPPPPRRAPTPKRSTSGALAVTPPDTADERLSAGELELESNGGVALELAVDTAAGVPLAGALQLGATLNSVDDDLDLDDSLALEPVAAPLDTTPWPRGRSDETPAHFDAREIEVCADFGPASLPFYLAPVYTWRVFTHRRRLERERAALQMKLAALDADRDELLVDITDSVRPRLARDERFRPLLDELASSSNERDAQERALATTNANLSRELSTYDHELERLHERLSEQSTVLNDCQAARDVALSNHQRAQAKLRRAQIEIRNATAKARALVGPEGGELPVELAAELSRLHQNADLLAQEGAPFERALANADASLAAALAPVTSTQQAQEAVRARRRAAIAKIQKQIDSESSELKRAASRHTDVARRLAHAVLDLKGGIPVDRALLDRLAQADQAVNDAQREVELRHRALDSVDRDTFRRGIQVALVPPLVLLALFVLVRIT